MPQAEKLRRKTITLSWDMVVKQHQQELAKTVYNVCLKSERREKGNYSL